MHPRGNSFILRLAVETCVLPWLQKYLSVSSEEKKQHFDCVKWCIVCSFGHLMTSKRLPDTCLYRSQNRASNSIIMMMIQRWEVWHQTTTTADRRRVCVVWLNIKDKTNATPERRYIPAQGRNCQYARKHCAYLFAGRFFFFFFFFFARIKALK